MWFKENFTFSSYKYLSNSLMLIFNWAAATSGEIYPFCSKIITACSIHRLIPCSIPSIIPSARPSARSAVHPSSCATYMKPNNGLFVLLLHHIFSYKYASNSSSLSFNFFATISLVSNPSFTKSINSFIRPCSIPSARPAAIPSAWPAAIPSE